MIRFVAAFAGVVALGVVVAVAFGAGALWIYGFFALVAVATALATGLGGNLITAWSRKRFEDDRPVRR
ncbi:MAG TPA: hypothetical protein VGJ77_21895 [Gaiellaceae bacterium]|jgi:hypothetical protein